LKTDPGWRRDTIARLYCDWLYDRPPTNARISPVDGSTAISAGFGLALALPPRQELIDVVQAAADGVLRQPLEMQIQGRVHIDGLVGRRRQPWILLVECLAHVIDEVRRFGLERALHDDERLARRAFCRVAGDVAGIDHRLEHDVAPIPAPGRVVERRQRGWRLKHAGDRRGFRERDVADVLSEEQARGLGDADDAERSALAQRHVVQVHLENGVLGRACRDDQRHPRFDELAAPRLLTRLLQRHAGKNLRQEDVARHLLRNGAGAREVGALSRAGWS
jgi:hypothetical protein